MDTEDTQRCLHAIFCGEIMTLLMVPRCWSPTATPMAASLELATQELGAPRVPILPLVCLPFSHSSHWKGTLAMATCWTSSLGRHMLVPWLEKCCNFTRWAQKKNLADSFKLRFKLSKEGGILLVNLEAGGLLALVGLAALPCWG